MKHSIGKEKAIEIYESHWWEFCGDREITEFQLFIDKLCCPFEVFHKALESSLGRPVFTHELGMNYEGIMEEFLGNREKPSMSHILELIPESKRIVVCHRKEL